MPKIECGVDYFFFRRLVFFFAATFFLFFAIAALLAMSGWRHNTVQSRIELHCHPITTAGKK
jgi:hypothetical protein